MNARPHLVPTKLSLKSRRSAVSLLLAFAGLLSLAGCGQDEQAATAAAAAPVSAPVAPSENESTVSHALQVDLPAFSSAVIRSNPAGIFCGQSLQSPVCTAVFPGKTAVTLSQTFEESNLRFNGWSGDCTGSDCTVSMDQDRKVRALYERVLDVGQNPKPPVYLPVCDAYAGPSLSALQHVEGLMHEHSAYSDGDPKAIPLTFYEAAKKAGYGFVGGSDHSDTYDKAAYFSVHDSCTLGLTDPASFFEDAGPERATAVAGAAQACFASPNADKLLKWESTLTQAVKASTSNFLAIRGFEWTSDVFGHINVYFSKNFSNAKTDGGFANTMETFWDWFSRSPELPGIGGSPTSTVPLGGGSDGLGVFNHPGDKCQFNFADPEPTGTVTSLCNWNRFSTTSPLQPLADGSTNPTGVKFNVNFPDIKRRMFGMELYNDANRGERYTPFFHEALDKGWYLSPVGSEDEHYGQYASEKRPKTVTVTGGFSEAQFREAWLARRTYALTPGQHLRIEQLLDEAHPMGSRVKCGSDAKTVPMRIRVTDRDGKEGDYTYKLFTNSGNQIGLVKGKSATFNLPIVKGQERWYYVAVWDAENKGSLAYAAPVWVTGK